MEPVRIGIIGGSGLYRMEGLTDTREHVADTPFGAPSDALLLGKLHGVDVAFLARHGRSHALIPSQIPFRANIYAMKALGGAVPVVGVSRGLDARGDRTLAHGVARPVHRPDAQARGHLFR